MRTKQIILAVGLLFVPLLSMADNVITLIGMNGEALATYDAAQVDSITLNTTMESYGNYAYDFNDHRYTGLVETAVGTLESLVFIDSDEPQVRLNNVDPYFAYCGFTCDNGYNIVLCNRTEWVADTLYLYADAGQRMGYDDACFYSYTGYLYDNYDEEMVFSITDDGRTFTYVNGIVVAVETGYYNSIAPGTSIVPDSLAGAPARRAPKVQTLQGKKVLTVLPKAEDTPRVKAAYGASQTLAKPSKAEGKVLRTERTVPNAQTSSEDARRRLFKTRDSERKSQATPAERAAEPAVTTAEKPTAGGSASVRRISRQIPGGSASNRRAMTADDITAKNDK